MLVLPSPQAIREVGDIHRAFAIHTTNYDFARRALIFARQPILDAIARQRRG